MGGGLAKEQTLDLSVGRMNEPGTSVAGKGVEHGTLRGNETVNRFIERALHLLLAAAAVEERMQLGVVAKEQTLQRHNETLGFGNSRRVYVGWWVGACSVTTVSSSWRQRC